MNIKEPKRYWLRLYDRFFDKHEIKILLQEDRDCVLFYLEMLLESISHKGFLRYNESRPYTPKQLACLFNMTTDRVEKCIEMLIDYNLIEVLEDGTFYLPAAPAMCGCETLAAERMRRVREKKLPEQKPNNVQQCSTMFKLCSQSTEIKDKSTEIKDNNNRSVTVPLPLPPKFKTERNENGTESRLMGGGMYDSRKLAERFATAVRKDQGAFFDPEWDAVTVCAAVTDDFGSLRRWRQLVKTKGEAQVREEAFAFWREITSGEDVDNRGATLNKRLSKLKNIGA